MFKYTRGPRFAVGCQGESWYQSSMNVVVLFCFFNSERTRQNQLSSAVLEPETQSFSTKLRSAQNSGLGLEFVNEPPFLVQSWEVKRHLAMFSPIRCYRNVTKICRLLSLTSKRFRENIYRFENSWSHLAIIQTVRLIVRHKSVNGLAM